MNRPFGDREWDLIMNLIRLKDPFAGLLVKIGCEFKKKRQWWSQIYFVVRVCMQHISKEWLKSSSYSEYNLILLPSHYGTQTAILQYAWIRYFSGPANYRHHTAGRSKKNSILKIYGPPVVIVDSVQGTLTTIGSLLPVPVSSSRIFFSLVDTLTVRQKYRQI